jgi:hypothetical protein
MKSPRYVAGQKERKDVRPLYRRTGQAGAMWHWGNQHRGRRGVRFRGPSHVDLPRLCALGDALFPSANWLSNLLTEGIRPLRLHSVLLGRASPPGQTLYLKEDGSNLPWVVDLFRQNQKARFGSWLEHLQTAIPDLTDVDTVYREDDKHRYLRVHYQGVGPIPSWAVSDGTLRLLALTLPAYLADFKGVYTIEEPENGVHPRAVEALFSSLISVYDAQVLVATHSPVVLSNAEPAQVLCFVKKKGATEIVNGKDHPALRDWRGSPNLSVLFAGGVLG